MCKCQKWATHQPRIKSPPVTITAESRIAMATTAARDVASNTHETVTVTIKSQLTELKLKWTNNLCD